ncbi:2-oxoglutarate and iron-dependent oxygenase domain-containing protein 3-like [Episyrphus balteatus]|uniref:2-oxoglutarate and iron-dependent oxygenase domain-containing protein 3-like n=1 Tax=Episyrphus balteatus TaxID=286459 RepID=UPI002485746A|nr:2-oxoglutarate and iron-dependent oxygenase domain-containing protein 3-like [Episyrphus balteatus]
MTKEQNIRKRKNESPIKENNPTEIKENDSKEKKTKSGIQFPDLGKATRSTTHRVWTRSVMIISVMTVVYFYTKDSKEVKFALQKETIPLRMQKVPCSQKYLAEMEEFPKCVPSTCGRFVSDSLITKTETQILLNLVKDVLKYGGSSGGASILDLHSGALSQGDKFINVYSLPQANDAFKKESLVTYRLVKSKIKTAIAQRFGIDVDSLYLTHPTFFSRITNETAKTIHDEYWHPHVDKETYESFHYTSLLYLNDYKKDFNGGRFLFIDGMEKNKTISAIEPKMGRVSAFTSGSENLHNVEKVTDGTRFAITISFTCNSNFAINDPKLSVD